MAYMPPPSSQRRTGLRRPLLISMAALVVILGGVAVYATLRYQHVHRVQETTRAVAAGLVEDAEEAFERVPALTGAEAGALRTYRNPAHLDAAERFGIDPPTDRDAADALLREAALVEIEDNPYFEVRDMDHSVPYVTEDVRNLLLLVGERFQEALREEGLPPYRYVITSGTRTLQDQRRLQGVNVNAASKSSHWFGTTVDLHYADFGYSADADALPQGEYIDPALLRDLVGDPYGALAERHDDALKAILGRVLRELQREGQLLAIYERRQPVYHITVADAVPEPAAATALAERRTDASDAPVAAP